MLVPALCALSMVVWAVSPSFLVPLVLIPDDVVHGQVWRLVTWPLANGPDLWTVLGLAMLWYFGRELHLANGVPVGLIARQPDLGTALLVLSAGLFVMFFAGLSWRLIVPPLVLGVIGYHHVCRKLLRDFEQLRNHRSHRWFRVFNEVSVLLFAAIVCLVVLKQPVVG